MAIRLDAHRDEMHRDQQWHKPVRVATTGSITIATGLNAGDTIDGVTLAAGDRVLVKDQGSADNGIYIAGVTPARAYDFLSGIQAWGGIVYVIAGTANGGKAYRNTNATLPTIGSTTLTFSEFGTGTIDWGETGDITTLDYDDTPDGGALDEAARADHRHGMPSAGGGGGGGTTQPAVVQQFASVTATPLTGTVPQAASDSVLLFAGGSVSTPRTISSITQTNVTWSALLGSASGTGASDARVDLWIGVPSGTPGTSVSVALAAGATNCTGVYIEVPDSLGLAGSLDQHVERNGGATAATFQTTGFIKPTAHNIGVSICAIANGTILMQAMGPFFPANDPITFGGFIDVGQIICETSPAYQLRATVPVQTSARWANLIADIV